MRCDKYSIYHAFNGKIKLGTTDKKDDCISCASNPPFINYIPNVFTAESDVHF